MKAAVGNAMLINIIITFLVVVLGMLVVSISYTKAFRVKNRIVDTIEYYDGDSSNTKLSDTIMFDINNSLGNIGYRLNNGKKCPLTPHSYKDKPNDKDESNETNGKGKKIVELMDINSNYEICIYKINADRGIYYNVTAYMYFDFPLIGDLVRIPVSGETKVFYE